MIVSIADEIAQRHHDVEDGILAKLFNLDELIKKTSKLVGKNDDYIDKFITYSKNLSLSDFITEFSSDLVSFYIESTINFIEKEFKSLISEGYSSINEILKDDTKIENLIAKFDIEKIIEEDEIYHDYLFDTILLSHQAQMMDGRAYFVVNRLFKAFISNPQQLPDPTISAFLRHYKKYYKDNNWKNPFDDEKYKNKSDRQKLDQLIISGRVVFRALLLRTICDHIAGMTDNRALAIYRMLYGIEGEINFE